jgi:hypothetical protein
MTDEWREKFAAAAKLYDGHVTHGSLEEQTRVVDDMLMEFVTRLELIGNQCLAGGHKSRSRMFTALAKSFKWRYIRHD